MKRIPLKRFMADGIKETLEKCETVNQMGSLQLTFMSEESKTTFVIMLGPLLNKLILHLFCCRCIRQRQNKAPMFVKKWAVLENIPLWTTLNWVHKNFRISRKDSSSLCRIPNPANLKSWGIPEFARFWLVLLEFRSKFTKFSKIHGIPVKIKRSQGNCKTLLITQISIIFLRDSSPSLPNWLR